MLFQYKISAYFFFFLLNITFLVFIFVDSAERKRFERKKLERLEKQKRKIESIVFGICFFSPIGWLISFSQGSIYDTTAERSLFFTVSLIFIGIMSACVPLSIILDKIERKIESLKRSEEETEISSAGITKRRFDLNFYIFLFSSLGGLFFITILIWGNFNIIFVAVFVIGFCTYITIFIIIIILGEQEKFEKQ